MAEVDVSERSDWFARASKIVDALTGLWKGSAPGRSDPAGAAGRDGEAEKAASSAVDTLGERQSETSTAESVVEPEAKVTSDVGALPQGQQESDHRRDLIRTLFNDFWTGVDEKPVTFAERLDAAEGYINERLGQRHLNWRLDPTTRKELGLPTSQAPRN